MGAGGLGREVVEAVRAINEVRPTWIVEGFLDDAVDAGDVVDGLPVLGPISHLAAMPHAAVVVCVGRPGLPWSRRQVVERLGLPDARYATIVHPSATIPPGSTLGIGSVVLAGVIATTPVRLGCHVAVMPGVIFTHDNRVDAYATFAAGVRLAGAVVVEEGAYLGSGALVREQRTIGRWALVGMGSAVVTDVPPGEVWAGVPARRLRSAGVPPAILARP